MAVMRAEPISILLNENFRIDKKIYFISGNEKTLMQKIKVTIIGKYQKNTNARITDIVSIKDFVEGRFLKENEKQVSGISWKDLLNSNLQLEDSENV